MSLHALILGLLWLSPLPMSAQAPLSYADLLARVRPTTEQARLDVRLAEVQGQLQDTRGWLREGPSASVEGAARRPSGLPAYTDKAVELEFPLFLAPGTRRDLEASLGRAHPLLVEAARREAALRLKFAYLDAWLAQRTLALREADLATVERWLAVTRRRAGKGKEAAYQADLVEGERLKAQQDLDEARTRMAAAWAGVVALAEVPATPVALADPGPVQPVPEEGVESRLRQGPLRQALEAQAELEAKSLRLKEAQALSRWSLRTAYGTEAEDH
ncbi:MAG: TolC family protein, partial [Acidobacteriota bacterium]|nr:TolC family protein [Acidobacteriota bacterium]